MTAVRLYTSSFTSFQSEPYEVHFSGELMYQGIPCRNAKQLYELVIDANKSGRVSWVFDYLKSSFLAEACGTFAFIIKDTYHTYVGVDIVRSKPLFILQGINENFIVTDTLGKEEQELRINPEKLEEFLVYGVVLDDKTIYEGALCLRAGELIRIANHVITSVRYFEYKPALRKDSYDTISEFYRVFEERLLNAFSVMLHLGEGVRRWIVPLSGGHDSRLIASCLHRLKIKNVLCYTYGYPDNEQARISKLVANALGFEWHFVEYTKEKWQNLYDLGLLDDYISYAFNGVSTPHLNDFLAIYELKSKGVIQEGDVILPGHTPVNTRFNNSNDGFQSIEEAIRSSYRFDAVAPNEVFRNNELLDPLRQIGEYSGCNPETFRAYFHWQEKHTKFIINSIRIYEYFDLRTRMPLWDKSIADLWLAFPQIERIGRQLLLDIEKLGLFAEPLNKLPFAGENKKKTTTSLKEKLKKLLPDRVILKLLRVTRYQSKVDEALNQIFASHGDSVKSMLDPVMDFPEQTRVYFEEDLNRLPHQMNYCFLTTLYTIRKLLKINDKSI